MRYTTAYDVGAKKRKRNGINEDSIAVTLYQDGHRSGYVPDWEGDNGTDSSKEATDVESEDGGVFSLDGDEGDQQENETTSTDRKAGVFVLADGAGGEDAGDIASYIATTVLSTELAEIVKKSLMRNPAGFNIDADVDALGKQPQAEEVEHAISEAINNTHREIIRYANETGSDGMYTTVVVGVKLGQSLHYGWVGDSRAYVINEAHREISRLTKDHSEVQRLEDQGKIDEVEAHVHPDGNRIDRAVGGRSSQDPENAQVRVDTNTVPLYQDDTVLLTSDGLIDAQTDADDLYYGYKKSDDEEEAKEEVLAEVVTDGDIRQIVLDADGFEAAADRFIEFSNEKGGKDNISVLLFQDEMLPPSPPAEGGLPEREIDPDTDLGERETIIET